MRRTVAEEGTYARLGTFVVLAALLAGLGAFVASGFYFQGPEGPTTSASAPASPTATASATPKGSATSKATKPTKKPSVKPTTAPTPSAAGTTGAEPVVAEAEPTTSRFPVNKFTVGAGILMALFIFTFDRALVAAPLNSYQFPPEVMEALWNPAADSKWFAVLNKALSKPSVISRFKQFSSVFFAGFLRVLVSLCISFLVADAMLFVVFKPEVDARVSSIRRETAAESTAAENSQYDALVKSLQGQLDALTAAGNPDVVALDEKIAIQQDALNKANTDLADLKALKVKEVYDTVKTCITISTGTQVCSSGIPGVGPAARAIDDAIVDRTRARTQANTALGPLRAQRRRAAANASGEQSKNEGRIGQLRKQLTDEQSRHVTALNKIGGEGADTSGVLVRHQAVTDLEADTNPSTPEVDRKPACAQSNWWMRAGCNVGRTLWPGTPMGAFVVAVRLFLIAVDLMPIILKLQLVLRRRRSYDAVKAALEERYVATAIDLVDERLVTVGGQLEDRASERKFQRTGTGASLVTQVRARFKHVRRQGFAPVSGAFGDLRQTLRRGFKSDDPNRNDPRLKAYGTGSAPEANGHSGSSNGSGAASANHNGNGVAGNGATRKRPSVVDVAAVEKGAQADERRSS